MAEEIRHIRPDEVDTYLALGAQAFQVDAADLERWRQNMRVEEILALFVDGEMRAAMLLHNMGLWFGGAVVATGGLSGVATPPQHRRQGLVGRLLAVELEEMRAAKQPLCALYPFYFPFYKRFGWAHVSDSVIYTIPVERLPVARMEGTWRPLRVATDPRPKDAPAPEIAEADRAILRSLYERWARSRNGLVARDDQWWRATLGRSEQNIFLWLDPAGEPRAYLRYSFKQTGEWDRQLIVREMVALDLTAQRAAWAFIRNHDSQASEVVVREPEDSRLLTMLADPRVKIAIEPGFMLRMVDVAAALTERRYAPGARGQVTLEVLEGLTDSAPHVYRLEIADGAGEARAAAAAPQARLDQQTLSQLYAGYMSASQAAGLGLITDADSRALALLDAALAGPKPFMSDFF
jgi:predicted acetyltransferase